MSRIKTQKIPKTGNESRSDDSLRNDAVSGTQNFHSTDEHTHWAKLRRLRIEENNLLKEAYTTGDYPYRKITISKYDKYNINSRSSMKLFDPAESYFEVRDLYLNLKESIKGTAGEIDVQKIKDMVYTIDEKLSYLQKLLSKEIADLKTEEISLISDIDSDDVMLKEISMPLKEEVYSYVIEPNTKKAYSHTSNIPCEVQKFQRFVRSTGGHTGKWGSFEHLLFVKSYEKYTCRSKIEIHDDKIIDKIFTELVSRIPELTMEAVATHYEWYQKYSRLKKEQQNAILKWKENKMLNIKRERGGDDESFVLQPKHRSYNKDISLKDIETTTYTDELQENILEGKEAKRYTNDKEVDAINNVSNTNSTDDSVLKTFMFNYQTQRLCRSNVENKKQLKENKTKRMSLKSTFDKPTEQSKNKVTAPFTKNDSSRLNNFTIADPKNRRSIPNWRKCLVGN